MGNRGFAISSLLYGLFIVFLIVFWSFMASIRTGNKQKVKFYEEVASSLEKNMFCDLGVVLDSSNSSSQLFERGKYLVSLNYHDGSSCNEGVVFLPDLTSFLFRNGKLMVSSFVGAFSDRNISIMNCQNSGIREIVILGYWCRGDENEGTQ